MKRAYAKKGTAHKQKPSERRAAGSKAGREIQLPLDREELLDLLQDSLEGLAVELGLRVASAILEGEVPRLCGARYERQPQRTHTRYGRQGGVVSLGGQKLPIEKPRVRRVGGSEVPLENYEKLKLQSPTRCLGPCSAGWCVA